MSRSRVLLLLLVLGCGCPQAKDPPPSTDGAVSPDGSADGNATGEPEPPTPPPPPPPPPETDGEVVDPMGPAGPAGPTGPNRRVPAPEDGVPQTGIARTVPIQVGGVPLKAWIADRPRSRTLGLMHVKSMPADRGMLFVYPGVSRHSFWMRNTYIPLSLAYVTADGTIDQILDMQPLTRESHPSKSAVKYVLEVNQGWFAKHGIKAGAKLTGIDDLRGF